MRATLSKTKFKDAPIVPVAAKPATTAADEKESSPIGEWPLILWHENQITYGRPTLILFRTTYSHSMPKEPIYVEILVLLYTVLLFTFKVIGGFLTPVIGSETCTVLSFQSIAVLSKLYLKNTYFCRHHWTDRDTETDDLFAGTFGQGIVPDGRRSLLPHQRSGHRHDRNNTPRISVCQRCKSLNKISSHHCFTFRFKIWFKVCFEFAWNTQFSKFQVFNNFRI